MNYDAWFDYLRLLESDENLEQVRETYERAIANIPPIQVYTAELFQYLRVSIIYTLVKSIDAPVTSSKGGSQHSAKTLWHPQESRLNGNSNMRTTRMHSHL